MSRCLLVSLASLCSVGCSESVERGSLEQAVSVCADGPTVHGIDVSRYQGDIDWQQVADADVVYAWIQISRSLTDIDQKFDTNWRRAREVGIIRGAYQRFQPDQDVEGQARLFLERLGPLEVGDMPPMLDVEDANGLGPEAIADAVREWMSIVEPALGVTPIIYTGFYFWRDEVGSADLSRHPLWVPNYGATCPLVPAAWSRWTFHQYSSTAVIPGITANTVDVNRFNGTIEDLRALGVAAAECGDGVCSSDETTSSCALDCPPCQLIRPGGATIDDSSECFVAGGDPQFIRAEAAGHADSLVWTHATDAAEPANYGIWNLHFAEAGRYQLEAFVHPQFGETERAVYRVEHRGAESAATVDQSRARGWIEVGQFDFAEGGGQVVRLDDNTGELGETKVVFDAIGLTAILDKAADEVDDDEPPVFSGDAAGCSASGTSQAGGGFIVLFAFLLLGLRRRRWAKLATIALIATRRLRALEPRGC